MSVQWQNERKLIERYLDGEHERVVTAEAIVARRQPRSSRGPEGLGLYLPTLLSSHSGNRRRRARDPVDFGVEITLDGQATAGRAIDWNRDGAGLVLRDLRVARKLKPGTHFDVRYRDPRSGEVLSRPAILARSVRTRKSTGQFQIGLVFADTPAAARVEVARASGIWSHSDLTRGLASEELETRAMLRRVVWRTDQGAGIGRLTLAEPDRVLVACTDDVPRSQTSATLALRPKDPGAPGVDLQVRVTGSGPRLLANRPGFDAEITGFDDATSYERYERLVGWVARNVTWRAP